MAAVVGGAAPRLSLPSRFGLLHTTRPWNFQLGTASSGYTFILQTGSECAFDWVRLIYTNNTGSTYTIGAASVASSASAAANGYSAYDGTGTGKTFTGVTFNAVGDVSRRPPTPSGSTTNLVVPIYDTVGIPKLVASDWMQVPSEAPTDGGTFHHLVVRTYISAGAPSMNVAPTLSKLTTDFPTIAGGRVLRSGFVAGDQTASATPAMTLNMGYVMPVAVQFMARKRGLTVLDSGDSLTMGTGSTSDHNGPGFQAARALSTPDLPVFFCSAGYAGQTTNGFQLIGKIAVDTYRPDVALVSIYSPNDNPGTPAAVTTGLARSLQLADYCIEKGVVPIIKTALPYGSPNATQDSYRIEINNRVRAMAPAMLVADYDAVVSNGATPARIKPAYDSGDGVHLNDAGYAACADILKPLLSRLIRSARAA